MHLHLRKILFTAVFLIAPLGVLTSQTSDRPPVIFKSQTELVTVPVIVVDKSGNHLHGLKKDDFILLQDGKPQTIATFDEIVKAERTIAPATASAQFSNSLGRDAQPINLTIVVLDLLNTKMEDQAYVKNQLTKYFAGLGDNPPPIPIFALTRGGLKIIRDFSSDPKSLATALEKAPREREMVEEADPEAIPAGTPLGIAMAMQRMYEAEQRMESQERQTSIMMTLLAMQQIAEACAGLPGRKAMLWASGGFPLTVNELNMVMNIAGPKLNSSSDVSAPYGKTWRALNQAQISVYPIDARGMATLTPDISIGKPRADYADHTRWMNSESISTFQAFAHATGGIAFYNTNDLKSAFAKAADDNSEYYMLSYYLDSKKKDFGWHTLNVRVRRDDTQVRARSGFFLAKMKVESKDKESEMRSALGSPLNNTGISISGEWKDILPAKEPGKKVATFILTMPANFAQIDEENDNYMNLEMGAVALAANGTVAGESFKNIGGHPRGASLEKIRNHGLDYRGDIVLAPGEYTVRFAVEDRLSGRIGTVYTHLKLDP